MSDNKTFYDYAGIKNPFEVVEPVDSLEAAQKVLAILGEGEIVDLGDTWNASQFPLPPYGRYSIKVPGASKPTKVGDIVYWFNNDNPERLRIDLNEVEIGSLGPVPLSAPPPFNGVAYASNYIFNPESKDPGPLPNWLLARIAKASKAKK